MLLQLRLPGEMIRVGLSHVITVNAYYSLAGRSLKVWAKCTYHFGQPLKSAEESSHGGIVFN